MTVPSHEVFSKALLTFSSISLAAFTWFFYYSFQKIYMRKSIPIANIRSIKIRCMQAWVKNW